MSKGTITFARPDQAEAIQAIYRPYVTDSIISFEVEPPTVDEIQQRIANTLKKWPWLVCEKEGQIAGYVYASKHRERAAYQWDVDVTAYLNPQFHRSGIGRALYTTLFAILRLQGYYNAYAGIALPNPASVGLHEAMGFKPIGVYEQTGYKNGAWHDVGWWQLHLQPLNPNPVAPTDFSAITDIAACQEAILVGQALLK
jgi:phosphinothricin acetyltransferase